MNNNIDKIPKKSIIILLLVILFIVYLIFYSRNVESKILKKLKNKNKNEENKGIFNNFLVKHTIIAGALAFLIGFNLRDLINSFVKTIISPIFNVDFDNDGTTDIKEIVDTFNLNLGGLNFKFGPFILKSLEFGIFLAVTYFIIVIFYLNTNLLNID